MNDDIGGGRGAALTRRPKWWVAVVATSATLMAIAMVVALVATSTTRAASRARATASVDKPVSVAAASRSKCSRRCMTSMVSKVLKSMVAHDPYTLPLAPLYQATENDHPAALGMMTLWRTVTRAGKPSLLAIDTVNEQAYFALDISEGSPRLSVLFGRIKVVDRKITQLELYVNRSRGDHGFSFSPQELPHNYYRVMHPPANRQVAGRATLLKLSQAAFNQKSSFTPKIASDCQFTEVGWSVVDPGDSGTGPLTPLGCAFPPNRPDDPKARTNLVIDQQLGIVVVGAVVPGKVYPYPYFGHMISAFIPDDIKVAQVAQQQWLEQQEKTTHQPLLAPMEASGQVLQVLQYYNGQLQALQINLSLGGPGEKSAWVH
jgi:hypothetical protein